MFELGRTNTDKLALWWRNIDRVLLFLILSLVILSIFFAYSSTATIASEKLNREDNLILFKHIFFSSVSFFLLIFISFFSPRYIEKYCLLGFVIASILLISVLVLGVEVKGSKRWLNLLFFRFQPVEFYKPFFILICCMIMSNLQLGHIKIRIFYSFFLLIFSLILLLKQPDVGQSLLITAIWFILIFVSGVSIELLISLFIFIVISICSSIFLFKDKFLYIFQRLGTFFDATKGDNLQNQKALLAIKQGGLMGRGLGEGILKDQVPEAHTDFVLAVIGEEFGIIMIILIFGIISYLFFKIFLHFDNENDNFKKLSLIGLSSLFYLQSIINIGVTLSILPNKGMTFPFLSYGGSSMIGSSIIFGILLCLSKKKYL